MSSVNEITSEVCKGQQGTAIWKIKNWARDHVVLQRFAECTVVANEENGVLSMSPPVAFRFSLETHEEKDRTASTGDSWLSLQVAVKSYEIPTPIILAVNVETNKTNPAEIRGVRATFTDHNTRITIKDKFIHMKHHTYDRFLLPVETKKIPQDSELQLKISVTTFDIANLDSNKKVTEKKVTTGEGATGIVKSVEHLPSTSLAKDLAMMFGAEENLSDLKLETMDGIITSAHRFILAARSPVLRDMIMDQIKKEDLSGTLKLPAVTAKSLVVILHWMYTGELHENITNSTEQIVETSKLFDIPELLAMLDKKLITVCSNENMLQLFHVAQQNNMPTAKEAISEFIKMNIGKV